MAASDNSAAGIILGVSPAQWCQALFLAAAGVVAVTQVLPADLRSVVLDYGARRPAETTRPQGAAPGRNEEARDSSSGGLTAFMAGLAAWGQVPHSWFLHFYVVSVAWSAFWLWQYAQRGTVLTNVALAQRRNGDASMEIGQVYVAWVMMALQGLRRLYESIFVSKPGSSPMLCVHWLLGLAYYTAMGMSVWVEGARAILESWERPPEIRILTPRTLLAASVYFVAAAKQNECHRYLASLKKYTLPEEGMFRYLICPHYTCECILYLALAVAAAPTDAFMNNTVLCGVIFVAVNLGVTAHGTKHWRADKFGAGKVAGRWRMIPFLF